MQSRLNTITSLINRNRLWLVLFAVLGVSCNTAPRQADYKVVDGGLVTGWAGQVCPKNVLGRYPRPQMVRKRWLNLNGLWDYAIKPKDQPQTNKFDSRILVPFPVESALSGVKKTVGSENRLWYRRTFEIPHKWKGKRILLHFGAVDWETVVWVNGKKIGSHRGGYDPFSFDITDALKRKGKQQLIVSVWDPTDKNWQSRGKQVSKPKGIWYTAVTGIWQTVWLEPVAPAYIKSLKITPDINTGNVHINADCSKDAADLFLEAKLKGIPSSKAKNKVSKDLLLSIKEPKLWSPDSPFLYDLNISLINSKGEKIDEVQSYFGMREVTLAKDADGITRIFLNNRPVFMLGPLDQGWWPDGLYTAPSDDALRYDIEITKKLGFNTIRKHVKIEPARWYYWCDKLGLLVWQDMPSGDKYIRPEDDDIIRSDESAKQFELELRRMIDNHYNSPSIIMWVIFNEGWGQYDTQRLTKWTKQYDPTRVVNSTSGWADRAVGDVHDIHCYPGPEAPANEEKRAAVLGEFGGLGLGIKNHSWTDEKQWGYRKYDSREQLTAAYLDLLRKLQSLKDKGLAAAIYTQTTDVETEVNGLMTYDRAIIKMDEELITEANRNITQ